MERPTDGIGDTGLLGLPPALLLTGIVNCTSCAGADTSICIQCVASPSPRVLRLQPLDRVEDPVPPLAACHPDYEMLGCPSIVVEQGRKLLRRTVPLRPTECNVVSIVLSCPHKSIG
jgi:hypothetical protein